MMGPKAGARGTGGTGATRGPEEMERSAVGLLPATPSVAPVSTSSSDVPSPHTVATGRTRQGTARRAGATGIQLRRQCRTVLDTRAVLHRRVVPHPVR